VPSIIEAMRALPVASATLDGEGVVVDEHGEIRRATLTGFLRKAGPGVRLSEHLDGDGATIFRHACALGAEALSPTGATGLIGQGGARIGSRSATPTHQRRRASWNGENRSPVASPHGAGLTTSEQVMRSALDV
jgi:hypothetical protein